MNHFMVTSMLITCVWFGFAVMNPFCNPNQWRIDSIVLLNNTNKAITSPTIVYFIDNTVVFGLHNSSQSYHFSHVNDVFKGDPIDTPVDVVYANGTDIIEIIKLKKLTQSYTKWRIDFTKRQVLGVQNLPQLMRKIFTTNIIAVMDINGTQATVVSNSGYVTVYTVDLMTGQTSDHLDLLKNGKQVMLGKPAKNWTHVSQLYVYEISAAYREKDNIYTFVANRYELRAEVNKWTEYRIETNPLSVKPCQRPDPRTQQYLRVGGSETNDQFEGSNGRHVRTHEEYDEEYKRRTKIAHENTGLLNTPFIMFVITVALMIGCVCCCVLCQICCVALGGARPIRHRRYGQNQMLLGAMLMQSNAGRHPNDVQWVTDGSPYGGVGSAPPATGYRRVGQ